MSYADLAEMISTLKYKNGWEFTLHVGATSGYQAIVDPGGLGFPVASSISTATVVIPDSAMPRLVITLWTPDSTSDDGRMIRVAHTFSCPPPTLGRADWARWLMHCIFSVEQHEAMEFFEVSGVKPFFPEHGPGGNLYVLKQRPGVLT